MGQINLGRIVPNYIGEWNNVREYNKLDVVSYYGSSYICKTTNKNIAPNTLGNNWVLLAKGADTDYVDDSFEAIQAQITKITSDVEDMDEWLNDELGEIDNKISTNTSNIQTLINAVNTNKSNLDNMSLSVSANQKNIQSISTRIDNLDLKGDTIEYKGIINIASSSAKSNVDNIAKDLNTGDVALCFIGDASGIMPSTTKYITVHSDLMQTLNYFFTTDAMDVNVGDILIISKAKYLGIERIMLKVIPLNDAKTNTVGLMTPWDKVRVNKVDGIEATANSALQMPTYGESNMNNAIWSGIYPWCTSGRPAGSTGAYTCIVTRTNNADWSGYYTIEQTAYGREGELGQIYKRIIFLKWDVNDNPNWGEWINITPKSTAEIERRVNDIQRGYESILPTVYPPYIISNLILQNYNSYITNAGDNADLYEFFINNNSIVYLPALDTSKVTSLYSTFSGCKNLIYVPTLNTEKVTSWNACFNNCESLTYIEELDFLNATTITNIFNGCTSLDYCLIKNIGNKSECTLIDFSNTRWGFGGQFSADSVLQTLFTFSADRKYFGYTNCEIKLPARTMYTCLTEQQRTQIENKGYTLTPIE